MRSFARLGGSLSINSELAAGSRVSVFGTVEVYSILSAGSFFRLGSGASVVDSARLGSLVSVIGEGFFGRNFSALGHIFGQGPLSVAEVAVMRSDFSARVESYSRGCD